MTDIAALEARHADCTLAECQVFLSGTGRIVGCDARIALDALKAAEADAAVARAWRSWWVLEQDPEASLRDRALAYDAFEDTVRTALGSAALAAHDARRQKP